MAVFLARMVMPRSRSSSLESITRSTWASLARKVPLWLSMASTRVVLPWSTCAMMAILRRLLLKTTVLPVGGTACDEANGGLRERMHSVYNTHVLQRFHHGAHGEHGSPRTESREAGRKTIAECSSASTSR